MCGLFHLRAGIALGLALAVPGCACHPNDRSLKPEAAWNEAGLWQRVADKPPTYVPTGYGVNRPRGERDGVWITDRRDGKKFFVPGEPVRGTSPGVLLGEACKITDFQVPRSAKGTARDVASGALYSIMALAAAMGDAPLRPPD
jgi:hypothetical protein